MNLENPLFSIIVPIYNEEQYIREALDSIVVQTDPDWEALLVNDGSTDSTPGILAEYAERDNRFRVFHKINGGQSSAINLGVRKAKGGWLCWLSGDDYFHPQKLEMHRHWMQAYPETDFFFTGFWLVLPNGKKIEYSLDWLKLENPDHHLVQLLHSNWVTGISVCIKRDSWLKTGEFDSTYRYAHDLDMWVRLMLNTRHQYLPKRTCTMRYHTGQETARFPHESMFDAAKILIRLINKHSFKELFPDADLHNSRLAAELLNRTIDIVAGESDAYIYKLGIHPLLHLRILEWLGDPAMDLTLRNELHLLLIERATYFIALHNESPFGLIWQAFRASLKADQPQFAFFPCEAAKVGEAHYHMLRAERSEAAQALRSYLEKNDRLSFGEDPMVVEKSSQLVLILPPDISLDDPANPGFIKTKEIWQHLTRAGFFILLVGQSNYTMGLVDGLPYIAAQTKHEQDRLLAELGDLDTVVALSHPERLNQATAERRVYFDISLENGSEMRLMDALLQKIQSAPRKKYRHLITARRLHRLRSIYIFLIPISVRIRLRLGQRLRLAATFLKTRKSS